MIETHQFTVDKELVSLCEEIVGYDMTPEEWDNDDGYFELHHDCGYTGSFYSKKKGFAFRCYMPEGFYEFYISFEQVQLIVGGKLETLKAKYVDNW